MIKIFDELRFYKKNDSHPKYKAPSLNLNVLSSIPITIAYKVKKKVESTMGYFLKHYVFLKKIIDKGQEYRMKSSKYVTYQENQTLMRF